MTESTQQSKALEDAPPRLKTTDDLQRLLCWFEKNICREMKDPRGHRVQIGPERFPYLVKLRNKKNGEKIKKPLKIVNKIREGKLKDHDFGGIDQDRAQTLTWLEAVICRPTCITKNKHKNVPGDEVYIKEFAPSVNGTKRIKAVVCLRMNAFLLVPISAFRKSRVGAKAEDVIWP